MRVRTLVDLLTLSTNVYMISKDEEFMKNLSEMADKGKKKFEKFMDDISTEPEGEEATEGSNGQKIVQRLVEKAKEAKEEFESRMEEVAKRVYAKMHIANTEEVSQLKDEIESLKKELALAESRIIQLEKNKHHH